MIKVRVTLYAGLGGTTASATGSLRESLEFVLTSFQKQLENEGGLAAIAELMQQNHPIEYALSIGPVSSNGEPPK